MRCGSSWASGFGPGCHTLLGAHDTALDTARVHRGPPPAEPCASERLRRRLMDLFVSHGYERSSLRSSRYLDSLLTAPERSRLPCSNCGPVIVGCWAFAPTSRPAARIDAHLLNPGVSHDCATRHVLHTLRPASRARVDAVGGRTIRHAGWKRHGSAAPDARGVDAAGIEKPQVDLGTWAFFRG